MNSFKNYIYVLVILFSSLFPSSEGFAASPTEGFSEEMQFQLIQRLFNDELHYSVQQAANIYLETFPEGQSREAVYFLRTRSNELRSNNGQNIQEVVKDYHQYRLTYPEGRWIEDAMFSEGYLRVRLGQYERSISILGEFVEKFPKSENHENALYWLGKAAFYLADSARQNQSLDNLRPLHKKVTAALSEISKPEQLTEEQQINRLYYLGWSYQFQRQPNEAQKWLLEYADLVKDKSQLAKVYYQLGQNEKEAKNYVKALTFFEKLDQFPNSPLFNRAIFWKAESNYQIFKNTPPTENYRLYVEKIIDSYQTYLKTEHQQYKKTVHSRIADLYYQLGKNEWNTKNYKDAITFFEKLTGFPEFPFLDLTIFFKAEGAYQLFIENPPAKDQQAHIEKIIDLYQTYLKTGHPQYRDVTYYRLGQNEWKAKNYENALIFFGKLEQFPDSQYFNPALFSKAEMHYLMFLEKPPLENQQAHIEKIIDLYQVYLETEHQQYRKTTRSRIADIYYQLGQNEWKMGNYKNAITYFEKLTSFPDFPFLDLTIFFKAEGTYQLFIENPPAENQQAYIEKIIDLYQAYLKTEHQQYRDITFYRLGQNEWTAKNYENALTFFEKLDQFHNSQYFNPALFSKAEIRYQMFLKNPPVENQQAHIEKIIDLYQAYLKTDHQNYQKTAQAHVEDLYYRLGQSEWKAKNYTKALSAFEKLSQSPDSQYFNPAVFWKAEVSYLMSADQPLASKNNSHHKKIIALYESYLKTKDLQYQAITYYRLGELHANIKQTKKAITYYQKYLNSGEITNAAEVHYELGKLFIDEKNDKKAIEAFQLARQSKTYQNDGTLIQLLVQLLEKNNRQTELQALLVEAKDNKTLKGPERNYFLLQGVGIALQSNNCGQVLKDLKRIPPSFKKANRHYLLYARGSCFIQKKQWKEAESDLISLIEDPEYEKLVFDLLIITYQGSKKWSKLTQHIEAFWQKENFTLNTQHFETLIAAYHQLQDWQKIAATYTRWESVHRQDLEKPELLINWAQAEEKLEHLEKSKILYERTLTLDTSIDLNLRESVVARLAESYLKDGDYQNYTRIYEKYLMPHLIDSKIRQKYAFALGRIYYDPLKEYDKARQWFKEVDQGQVTDLEIEAVQLLSAIEEAEGKIDQAIQVLNELTQRPLQTTQWNLVINYQLGSLYEGQKQWSKALEKYRIVADHSPVIKESEKVIQKNSQERIREIERSLARGKLDRFIEQKAWKQVVQLIQNGIKMEHFIPSHELYEILVHAEFQQENWNGILSAYEEWGKLDRTKTKTLDALLTQGQAAENLSNDQLVKEFYGEALKLVSVKDLQTRIFLTERLGEIYEKEANYKKIVELYEKTYPFLNKRQDQIRFSYKIGDHYLTHLNQKNQARKWFAKTDKGGTSVEELTAIWNLVEMETRQKKSIQMLARLASRPISKESDWYIVINYKLGILYQKQTDYSKAIIHYNRVAKAKPSKQYGEFQQTARKQAKDLIDYQKKINANQKVSQSNPQQ